MRNQADGGRAERWGFWAIVILAAILRVGMFPHPDEERDVDEVGYLKGSLALLEGLPPGYKAAPAGPNLWVGWLAVSAESVWHFAHPGALERRVPLQVRPFVAIDHTLFSNYHDLTTLHMIWIATQVLLTIFAVGAAFKYGASRGGVAGGFLVGGIFASMPLVVDFSEMSRPYATAWAFGILAVYFARCAKKHPASAGGIWLGLAVASRIEMLIFAPLVIWELWDRRDERRIPWRDLGKTLGVMAITSLLFAPWLMTHLVGNLRTIATVRLGENPHGPTTLAGVVKEIAIDQGLIGAMLLCVVAVFVQKSGERIRVWVLGAYLAFLVLSLGHGTVFLHQQGPIILMLILFSALGIAPLVGRWPKSLPWVAAALLILPVVQTLRLTMRYRRDYVPELSTRWVEQHVPPGTRVYVQYSMHDPLPTVQAADFLWNQVWDEKAAAAKFRSGLARFKLSDNFIPRALGEENLVQEQGNRRGWFIMGGNGGNGPRFDVRVIGGSPVFDIHDADMTAAFDATGGVLVYRGMTPPPLGTPVVKWTAPDGN
ncbi:MAG TPA: hypothetical protein VMD30_06210, partial [Tepidisphaeraceae bacterium]|nr:hypothetical protein [Tepidisphaeraceae bacterium]